MDDDDEEIKEEPSSSDPHCSRCGLRSYDNACQSCGAPVVSKSDDEEEDYDWREHKR
jgi:ribosomal protein L37E